MTRSPPTLHDKVIARVANELRELEPAARGEMVRRLAGTLGVSVATVYRRLEAAGWDSGRAARADKGASKVAQAQLEKVSEIMAAGRSKKGTPNVPLKEAVAIAQQVGALPEDVSRSTVGRLLRREGLSLTHMRAPEAGISRVSVHPNHVWFFDISVAIQWYFRDEEGRKLGQYVDAGARFYEGKRQNLAALRRVIHRFAVTDHCTGAYFVRYYYSAGEATEDVVDFLWHAFAPKPGNVLPMHGLPRRLVMDQGPANKSGEVLELLRALEVEVEHHKPRNAKASGSVETRHGHWQRSFEGRLAVAGGARDLEQLNEQALLFAADRQAEQPLTRHGRPPSEAWLDIRAEQLREPPERDLFFELASSTAREGTLDNRLHLRAKNRRWYVAGEHVHPGQKVAYRLMPFSEHGIRVWDAEGRELVATELSFDRYGFPEQGPRHVWDDAAAAGARTPEPAAQVLSREIVEGAREVVLPGVFDDLGVVAQRQTYIARQGQAFAPPATGGPLVGSLEIRERVVARLGRALSREEARWWNDQVGAGVNDEQFNGLWAAFTTTGNAASKQGAG